MTPLFLKNIYLRPLLAVALAASMGSSFAGLFDDEEARRAVLDLRQKIETLKLDLEKKQADGDKFLSEEDASIRRSMLDLQNQLTTARSDIDKLRGQNEQLLREISDIQRRYKDSTQSLQERLRNLEPTKASVDGQEFLAIAVEKRDYEEAFGVFRNGDFLAASRLLSEFLNRYSQSGFRPSALFWLGNAQYANKDYKESLNSFKVLLAIAPDHMRAPEAMLAVANCQVEMKDSKAARKTWETLLSTYPNTEAAEAARDRLSRFK